MRFLRNSNAARYERNTISNLRLALRSVEVLGTLCQELNIDYAGRRTGALKIFRSPETLDRRLATVSRLVGEGLRVERLNRQQILEIEPALEPISEELAGAIHYASDEVGDAHRFCVTLAEEARREGVGFCFGLTAQAFELRSGSIAGVRTNDGRLRADHYVLAAGSYSPSLAGSAGMSLPVAPAKGYSVTFSADGGSCALKIPIVDDDLHAGLVPLDGMLRVAGTAEFAGFDLTLHPERVRNLISLATRLLPRAGLESASARPWCGLRPMSADGVPIIGAAQPPNLWINTGHGHLGWTMAAGSAELLADLLCGRPPSLDPAPYAPARFLW